MYKEINSAAEFRTILSKGTTYSKLAFQDVDFYPMSDEVQECWFSDCIFLGGKGVSHIRSRMDEKCLVFPSFSDMPFNTFRNTLYNASTLY